MSGFKVSGTFSFIIIFKSLLLFIVGGGHKGSV